VRIEEARRRSEGQSVGLSVRQSVAMLLLSLSAVAICNGCLSRPSLRAESFIFAIPTATRTTNAASGRVLSITRLNIAGPFDSQSFVYRTGEYSYEHDPYAQFLVPPSETLRSAMEAYWRGSGLFRTVAEPGSLLPADTALEVYVEQLYGDFRKGLPPSAVLEMQLTFFGATNGAPTKVLFKRQYQRRTGLATRTAAALVGGWNDALNEVLKEAAADFRSRVPGILGQMNDGKLQ